MLLHRASLLACSEDRQKHFTPVPQGPAGAGSSARDAQPGLSTRGAAPRCPYRSAAGPAMVGRVNQQSSNDQTTPNVPVLELCCLRQHFPLCSSPDNPAAIVMLQLYQPRSHLQVLGLSCSWRQDAGCQSPYQITQSGLDGSQKHSTKFHKTLEQSSKQESTPRSKLGAASLLLP